ncbi:uncharacterized protein LOC133315423 [Gastrolobium bilobum]|uniref:uncharacterized protein LOC133315423 n=1 Tax=Gastrolobium bilobum TaxID=150636 RepID=UPI002AB07199|nr:uncharacterized protein LOC133315423 [Gastrolobium bilobum]
MRITRGTTFEQLKANIHQKLGFKGNQRISQVTIRALAGNYEYTAISITDDDDVDIILDIFVEQADTSVDHTNARKFVEIYVDFENIDVLSIPIWSLDLNIAPDTDNLNRNASPSVLPVAPNNLIFDAEDLPTYDRNDEDDDEEEEDEDVCLAADINDDESASEDDDDSNPSDVPIGFQNNVNESTSTGIVGYQNVVAGDNVTPNVNPNVTPFWNGIPHYSYINYEYPNEDRKYNERDCHGAWTIGDELFVKQEFESKESVQMAVKPYYMVKEEPHVSISLIQEKIQNNYGFTISYRKARKDKQKAMAKIYGDWDQSYAYLPKWFNYMLKFSEGSVYLIHTNDYVVNHRVVNGYRVFHRIFWTFKQCCDAFNFCKPVIQVDGTHLYGKYKGTLPIATTHDGNNEVLSLAFAVVEGETKESWEYFLSCIRLYVTQKTGYTPSKVNFDVKLEEFRSNSPEVAAWIDAIPKEKWSRAYNVDGRHYCHMTTNLSECVNSIFKGARGMPITALVKHTYSKLVHYFVKRGHEASLDVAVGIKFCHNAHLRMEREAVAASSHIVRAFNRESTLFEVEEPYNPITQKGGYLLSLYLNERKCQCGKFEAFKYPCSHVRAVCLKVGMTHENFVDPCYSILNINKVYASPRYSIGNEDAIPPYTGPILLPDPHRVRAKGRPKRSRIHNEMDQVESSSSRTKCGVCGRIGHNRRSCPACVNIQ